MAYVAQKPCSFAGISFKIGETVPGELIVPGAISSLLKMKILSVNGQNETHEATTKTVERIEIKAKTDEGYLLLSLTPEGLQNIFDVLSCNLNDAAAIISQMTDSDALILLHISDSRKGVKEAAETRAKEIAEGSNESGTEGDLTAESDENGGVA